MELKLSMDRVRCIVDELKNIGESGKFESVELTITEFDLRIRPIAEEIKIVLKRIDE